MQHRQDQTTITTAKTATSLSDLLDNAATAFELMTIVEEKTQEATDSANAATGDATVQTVGGLAVLLAAGGGGFLYWKRLKKKKGKPGKKKGVVKELEKKFPEDVEEQKKGKKEKLSVCPKCKTKVGEGHKFCPNCGNKIL